MSLQWIHHITIEHFENSRTQIYFFQLQQVFDLKSFSNEFEGTQTQRIILEYTLHIILMHDSMS